MEESRRVKSLQLHDGSPTPPQRFLRVGIDEGEGEGEEDDEGIGCCSATKLHDSSLEPSQA